MKKTLKKIIVIFVMILLVNTLTGCLALGYAAVGIVELGVNTVSAIHDAVEEERYYKAAVTVVEYDDQDSF